MKLVPHSAGLNIGARTHFLSTTCRHSKSTNSKMSTNTEPKKELHETSSSVQVMKKLGPGLIRVPQINVNYLLGTQREQ